MAAVEGTLFSGWLYKKKSEGSKTKFIGGHNKRYFTLDFATEVFFYAHSDKEKKVSAPVAFTDLLEVKAQPPKKASFGLMGREAMPFSLCLHTFGKEVWLFSSDETQISAWTSQLSRAIAIGKERRDSRCQSRASAVSASAVSASTLSASTAVPGSGQITPQEVSRGATPDAVLVEAPPSGPPAPVMAPPERMVEPAVLHDSPVKQQPEGWGAKPAGAPYDDKSAGLSLHERLAQLQFSDSESDDEDDAVEQDPHALVASVLDGVDDVDLMPAGYGTADARPRPRDGAPEAPPEHAPEAPTVTVALVEEQPASPPPVVESWDSPSPQKEPLVMRESSWDEPAPHAGALQATQANDMVVRESSWDNPSPVVMRESSWDK